METGTDKVSVDSDRIVVAAADKVVVVEVCLVHFDPVVVAVTVAVGSSLKCMARSLMGPGPSYLHLRWETSRASSDFLETPHAKNNFIERYYKKMFSLNFVSNIFHLL